ncbi:tetratricopeptide repeat protein, partial [Dactylosporangium sp. NPDC005572]|uniref:tetratricopeptide repeat protein n=1 Tax=Dactylosporangium sp. NPDC005572 TaxID=3156889 RepID=UPI0033B555A4
FRLAGRAAAGAGGGGVFFFSDWVVVGKKHPPGGGAPAPAAGGGRHARAAQMYRRAIDHGDATAIMPLSMLRERAGDHRGADELAVRAVELGDRRPLERFALRADDRGDTGRADALAHAAADAGDANVLCLLARRHPGTDRAETLYRAAAERGSVPASAAFAVIAFGRGDAADVERFARQAAAGGDTSALRRIADLHRHSGAYRQAERFAIAAAVYGHAFEHRVLREEQRWLGKPGAVAAALRRIAGDVDTAAVRRLQACQAISVTRALTMALRLACHRHTGPLRALATDRQRHGDQAGALRLAVIADRCADPSALTELALLADASADHAAAVQLAERAASHGDSTALRRLARAHRRTGDIDDAVQLLERATAGGDPDALFDLARTRHHAGDADTAEPLYRDAARGGSGDAANALAHLLQDTDPPAAARYAERAVQLGHPTAVRDLGRARYRVGDLRAAAALYRQAADGGDDTAARLLAQLWDRHHHDEAAELAIEAAEHGSPVVLRHLAGLREGAGRFDEAAALYWSAYVSGDQQALMQLPHMRAEDDGDQARADRLTLQTTPAQRQRAVADLGAVRALTGDLAAAERLYRRAAAAGVAVDLRPVIRARLATDAPLRESVATLYERAGAHLVLARRDLAARKAREAAAKCVLAANLADPDALPELVRLNRQLGDRVTADMIDRYGLTDDGECAAW